MDDATRIPDSVELEPEIAPWKPFFGTHIGQSPTDESALAFGEAELMIDKDGIVERFATGLEMIVDEIPFSELVQMTPDEMAACFKNEPKPGLTGFKARNPRSALKIFLDGRPGLGQPDIIMSIGMGDMLGPTIFHSKKRRFMYAFIRFALWALDRKYKGNVPRLKYNGLTRDRFRAGYSKGDAERRFREHLDW